MEMPEQEIPVVFSQMLQMFPNIPHDVIWMYVQRYSSDVEKCAQMLNLQNGKYGGLQLSTLDNGKNLNKYNNVHQAPQLMLNSETIFDNNNDDDSLTKELLLSNNGSNNDLIEDNVNENVQTEQTSYDSHSSYSSSLVFSNPLCENIPSDSSRNLSAAISFNEPLILDIVPDDVGMAHSWRPNISSDILCSDLFVPSSMFENFHLPSDHTSNINFHHNQPDLLTNSDTGVDESWRYPSGQLLYDYQMQDGRNYGNDIANYLHYQKSQMNAIRYEVIKAKIELSDLKDSVEKLNGELKEKMQSKCEQDIVNLNKEIEQLMLDCQCLCSEVDDNVKDPVLLGDTDEGFYEKSSSINTDIQHINHCSSSVEAASTDNQEESKGWHCIKCTFTNHPAINACEMCHLPRPVPSLLAESSSSYCHSKEKSLSVES